MLLQAAAAATAALFFFNQITFYFQFEFKASKPSVRLPVGLLPSAFSTLPPSASTAAAILVGFHLLLHCANAKYFSTAAGFDYARS